MARKTGSIELPVVILKTRTGYSAFSPEIDGCVATGKSLDETLQRIKESLEFHLEGEQLVKHLKAKPHKLLKSIFKDYGSDALYASIEVRTAA